MKVFVGNRQVGLGYAQNGFSGITVWGDDPEMEAIDGAVEGELLTISNFNLGVKYVTDGFEAIEVKAGLETRPTRFELISVYPNPFNSTTRISYNIPNKSKVSICLYDISGRIVATLVNSEQVAGSYNHILNADGLSAGIYFVRMDAGAFSAVQKVVLVK